MDLLNMQLSQLSVKTNTYVNNADVENKENVPILSAEEKKELERKLERFKKLISKQTDLDVKEEMQSEIDEIIKKLGSQKPQLTKVTRHVYNEEDSKAVELLIQSGMSRELAIECIIEARTDLPDVAEYYSETLKKSFVWNRIKKTVLLDGNELHEDEMMKLFGIGFKSLNEIAKEEGIRIWDDSNEFTGVILKNMKKVG